MNFSFTGSGTIEFNSCTKYRYLKAYPYKWLPGQIVYYKPKAQIGKLEKIVVKKVQVVRTRSTDGTVVFMYIDTFNSIYNEYDLISEIEALVLAKQYYQQQIIFAQDAINPCRTW